MKPRFRLFYWDFSDRWARSPALPTISIFHRRQRDEMVKVETWNHQSLPPECRLFPAWQNRVRGLSYAHARARIQQIVERSSRSGRRPLIDSMPELFWRKAARPGYHPEQ
jgi:hypothetical protein